MNTDKIAEYSEAILEWTIAFIPKIILALLILWIGLKIVQRLSKAIRAGITKSGIDKEMVGFLSSIIDLVLKFIVILIAAGIIGFEVSSLLGVLAAAGFAIGLALQGFLGNFASGITIVFFKPYKVGDWVEVSEKFGRVTSIQIFNTIIETPGSKTLIIPNGKVTDNIITNFSTIGRIRLELEIPIGYEESFPKIKKIILDALGDYDKILEPSKTQVGLVSYDSHNIVVSVRPYIQPDDYWEATFSIHEQIKTAFNQHGIKMAYSEGVELGPIGA
ncbi:MAG: mechanosensitive ion channel family protein [Bacteroidia bacterium]|nr:mechanosensitive ion channel family protein [Bacteroidia bacterium]